MTKQPMSRKTLHDVEMALRSGMSAEGVTQMLTDRRVDESLHARYIMIAQANITSNVSGFNVGLLPKASTQYARTTKIGLRDIIKGLL